MCGPPEAATERGTHMPLPPPVPELPVSDLQSAGEFYRHKMGFSVDWVYQDYLSGISRDDARIFLRKRTAAEVDDGYSVLIWLNLNSVAEVDRLYDEWTRNGVPIMHDLETSDYSLRQFVARDADGNLIRVFHDLGSK
jgi:predicted lactoylglutathione lyase